MITRFSRIHPLRNINVCTKFHRNPSDRCRSISVWTKKSTLSRLSDFSGDWQLLPLQKYSDYERTFPLSQTQSHILFFLTREVHVVLQVSSLILISLSNSVISFRRSLSRGSDYWIHALRSAHIYSFLAERISSLTRLKPLKVSNRADAISCLHENPVRVPQ